jgi:hypothetical protein
MPNGGPTPDCVHCKNYRGRPYNEDESFCTLHQIKLASRIYVFCARYADPEPDEKGDWLDQMLGNRAELRDDMMYLWLGGYEVKFFHIPLAPISEYANWTPERFLDDLEILAEKYRNQGGKQKDEDM